MCDSILNFITLVMEEPRHKCNRVQYAVIFINSAYILGYLLIELEQVNINPDFSKYSKMNYARAIVIMQSVA